MQSDKDLVDAVLRGDRAAFATLVARYERPVRSVAMAILRNSDAAEDVAQDTLAKSYEKLATLRNRAAFGSWVLKIAQRVAYRVARDRKHDRTVQGDAYERAAETPNKQLDDRTEGLLQALVRLPKHEKIAVMLRYFDNESIESIATITGCSVGTVTKQLTRARDRLKKILER
jgi:RNA polymerase sigma-70 factor (ECF subfamily)